MNYYNEHDPKKAAWLRELIAQGLVADGEVDERSIGDIVPTELSGYIQCHFFAGIGVWSYALRLAGWPDDRPVWTGSCPCQSFSAAGKGAGFDDERHLWPAWFHLISECKPERIFGEQVGAAIGFGWLDLVHDDLEAVGYTLGSVVLPACSVGAPHIRQRLWIVAHAGEGRRQQERGSALGDEAKNGREGRDGSEQDRHNVPSGDGENNVAHADGGHSGAEREQRSGEQRLIEEGDGTDLVAHAQQRPPERHGHELAAEATGMQGEARQQRLRADAGDGGVELGDAGSAGPQGHGGSQQFNGAAGRQEQGRHSAETGVDGVPLGDAHSAGLEARDTVTSGAESRSWEPSTSGSFWSDCEWLPCTDGKARPVEPGVTPLAYGAPERVLRLRGYGDAIVPQLAAEFIRASCDPR